MGETIADTPGETEQEAPEEAGEHIESPKRAGRTKVDHTIASLRLDLHAAQEGRPWLLLPEDIRKRDYGGTRYPLPNSYEDLALVAAIPLKGSRSHESARYIYRCRKALKARVQATEVGVLDSKLAKFDEVAAKFTKATRSAREDIRDEMAKVRSAARETLTTIQGLNSLAKEVGDLVLKAYRDGQPVHGVPITTTQALDAMGKVFTHTRGMAQGALDADGKAEAEDELMKELAKASQERILRQQGGGGSTH